jgi:hypothetical protein
MYNISMKRIALTLILVLFQISSLWAADLFDLRVFPIFNKKEVSFQGIITEKSTKLTGTSFVNKLTGLRSRWMKSGSIILDSGCSKTTVIVGDGEFHGTIKVKNLASFTMTITHNKKTLHQEHFSFPSEIDFVVVSDIDDTILVTEVTSTAKMAYNSFFKNVDKRKAVAGTPDLYTKIAQGNTPFGTPHFVYLSSSPAFLSRSIKLFLKNNNFPQGTLVLKKSLFGSSHDQHKLGWLNKIKKTYGDKPMLLFGDSGEQDPFIYRSFVEQHGAPSIVKGVIIHEVTGREAKQTVLTEFNKHLRDGYKVPLIQWRDPKALIKQMQRQRLLNRLH